MSLDKKTSTDIVSGGNKTPLVIFKTKEDRNETDISKMSNFFEDYVHEMTLSIVKRFVDMFLSTNAKIGNS